MTTTITTFAEARDNDNLLQCLREIMAWDNWEAIRLSDGAFTWSADLLYDAHLDGISDLVAEEIYENHEYSVQADGIYRVQADGYLRSIPDYVFAEASE